ALCVTCCDRSGVRVEHAGRPQTPQRFLVALRESVDNLFVANARASHKLVDVEIRIGAKNCHHTLATRLLSRGRGRKREGRPRRDTLWRDWLRRWLSSRPALQHRVELVKNERREEAHHGNKDHVLIQIGRSSRQVLSKIVLTGTLRQQG